MDDHKSIDMKAELQKNKAYRFLDNFWYHYKWHTIIALFFVFVLLVCLGQCNSKDATDLTVAYAGGKTLSGNEILGVREVLSTVTPDKSERGEKMQCALSTYAIYTDEELRALFTDEDGNFSLEGYERAKLGSNQNAQNLQNYMMTGDSALWLVSEHVYNTMMGNKEWLVPLSELNSELSAELIYDEYAVRLSETAFYNYYDGMKALPEDTLVLVRKLPVWKTEEDSAVFRQMFTGIVTFKEP